MPAGTLRASSRMRRAARRGRATSSATAQPSARSACAFASATRPVPSSCAGHPTWASSAASTTFRSPETDCDIGAVGDQGGDPAVGEEARDAGLVVDGPDPRRDTMALAVTQHGEARELLVNRNEVGVAALQPAARKEFAEPHAKLVPRRKAGDLLADREPGLYLRKLLLDSADRDVFAGDDELVDGAAVERGPNDFAFVAGLLQVQMEADAPAGDVEQLVERHRLGAELLRQLAVSKVSDGTAGDGAVVVADDSHAVPGPADVELDEVDTKLDGPAVALCRRYTIDDQSSPMSADQWSHRTQALHVILPIHFAEKDT